MDDSTQPGAALSLPRYTVSFGIALAVASIASALLVVAKEKSPAVMNGLKKLTGHHWATHSLLAVLIFVVLGLGLARLNGGRGIRISPRGLAATLIAGIAAGGLIIFAFYLLAD